MNRQYLLNIRAIFAEAAGNLADAGRKEEAIKLLEKEAQNILPENLPYGMTSRYSMHNQTGILLVEAHYKAGMFDRARQIAEAVRKDIVDQRAYYEYLKNNKARVLTQA